MQRILFKNKIHRIIITQTDLNYRVSITLDKPFNAANKTIVTRHREAELEIYA
jgi:aspartate 1-decarboxylase